MAFALLGKHVALLRHVEHSFNRKICEIGVIMPIAYTVLNISH